jgi:hypothetical protein
MSPYLLFAELLADYPDVDREPFYPAPCNHPALFGIPAHMLPENRICPACEPEFNREV